MKLIILGTCLLFTCVCSEVSYTFDDNSGKNERKLYDVNQNVQDAKESFRIANILDRLEDFLINNNIYDYVKLLDALNIIQGFINSFTNAPLQSSSLQLPLQSSMSNSTCFDDLSYIQESVNLTDAQNSWAAKMLDSYGKPESGLLEGNLKWLGDFDECRSIYAPKKNGSNVGGFHGQYCLMQATLSKSIPLTIGVCLPDTCHSSDFEEIAYAIDFLPALFNSSIGFNVTSITCKPNSLELSPGGIVTLCIMSAFFILVFLGSSVTAFKHFTDSNGSEDLNEIYSTEERTSVNHGSGYLSNVNIDEPLVINEGSPTKLKAFIDMCDPFLNCFCIFTNGSKLLNTDSTEGQLLCLNGIRFLSITWVILCHIYLSYVAAIRSVKKVVALIDNLPFQAILNGWYSVDSFFVLSGFLMAYLYFQERAKNKGKTPWLYFYVHRYLRLTPIYMIVLAFYSTVLPVMGSGPFWTDTNVDPHCRKGWWYHVLYINNFQNLTDQCMGWSWYLANDMQFFVVSPLFLITLWRWPKIGYSILFVFLWGSWLSAFLITYHYDLLAGTFSYVSRTMSAELEQTFITKWNDYTFKIYIRPYTRIAPYLIGIGLGYIMFKRKTANIKIERVALWIGWLLAVVVGLYCVYGVYHQTPSLLAASFYNALSRTGYGLSLSWLIFACLSGKGGVVNKILSYKLFIPLSRLTYSAYLIHPVVVSLYILSLKTTVDVSHQTMVLVFLGVLVVTYAFSLVVSLVFESPIIRLEKLIRNKFQKK